VREFVNISMAAVMTGLFATLFWVQVGVAARLCADTPSPHVAISVQ